MSTPKTNRKARLRVRVKPDEVAEAVGHVMRQRIRRLTDTELGRLVLLLTTGRAK